MKQIFLFLLMGIFLINIIPISAQEIEANPGITPDIPILYGIDRALERIRMILSLRNESKVNYGLKVAEERLAEIKVMQERNRIQALERASKGYEDIMGEIENRTGIPEDVKARVRENSQKHIRILQNILTKVPEQNREGIRNAIERSNRVKEKFR